MSEIKDRVIQICQKYWIPAEELEIFNNKIVGKIEVVAEFY